MGCNPQAQGVGVWRVVEVCRAGETAQEKTRKIGNTMGSCGPTGWSLAL